MFSEVSVCSGWWGGGREDPSLDRPFSRQIPPPQAAVGAHPTGMHLAVRILLECVLFMLVSMSVNFNPAHTF